jgi:hypothetical protein
MIVWISIGQYSDGLRAGGSVVDSQHDQQIFIWHIESRPAVQQSSPLHDE